MSGESLTGWIWSGEGKPFRGVVHLRDDWIESVERLEALVDDDVLIVPGFVNAHCHLDLSVDPQTPTLEGLFTDWLLSVRDRREQLGESGMAAAANAGVEASIAGGTTTLVDHDYSKVAADALASSPLRRVLLREIISFGPLPPERNAALESYLHEAPSEYEIRGVAPHAPYTVHPTVLQALVRKSQSRSVPCSIHVQEQPFEAQFMEAGTGPYADFFEKVGVDLTQFPRPGRPAVQYLADHGWIDKRTLLVHCNYLSSRDIEILKEHNATVVFCPRSHSWFGHPRHPLPELLAAGVRVALGTDGRISNGELSLLAELQELHRMFPELDPEIAFRCATISGHEALDNALGTGKVEAGAPADLVQIRLAGTSHPPLQRALGAESSVVRVFIGGHCAFSELQ